MTPNTTDRPIVETPTDTQILITREFDAPPELLYRVWTTPELIRRWWHANRGEITVVEVDLRVGGAWRYAMIANGGFEVAFHGTYREIVPNERIVATEVYEGVPDAPALTTTTFAERDGGTLLTILVEHASPEFRDAHAAGMQDGLRDALALAAELAASLA
jgi:uncharacterized protein YndB with AHSA1/START domain